MPLHLLMNELSEPIEDCQVVAAAERLHRLVATIRAARELAPAVILNAARPIAELSLGANWPLAVLRNRPDCVDAGLYLKTVVDSAPFIAALQLLPVDAAGGAEYRLQADAPVMAGAMAVALGLAHETAGLAVSLPTHAMWGDRLIDLDRTGLDAVGELETSAVRARNASAPEDVAAHSESLLEDLRPTVTDGVQMWADRGELFPHLAFIPRTRAQLEGLQPGTPVTHAILERLTGLDRTIAAWRRSGDPQPSFPFFVTGESRRRLGLVDFQDANGATRSFSDHARYTPDEGRIHFILEDGPERRALVGHVGRKLGIG